MPPQKRNRENKRLPQGWRHRYNAYYYQVPKEVRHHWDNKSEFKLGKTLTEAHATFAQRTGYLGKVHTIAQLCDRYVSEVVSKKGPATQRSNHYSIARIRQLLGKNQVIAVQSQVLYEYQDYVIKNESTKKAALDHEVLSHMFTYAIRWGVIPGHTHPMVNKGVVKPAMKTRKVKPIESEMIAFILMLPIKWQLYCQLKIWLARRKGEIFRILRFDISQKGIRFINNKNPNDEFIQPWEPETRALVEKIQALPGAINNTYLFETRGRKPYINLDQDDIKKYGTTSGFDSMWQRNMTKAVKSGMVTVRFTEHDLRKIRPSQLTTAEAQELLRHTNPKQTETYQVGGRIMQLPSRKGQK